MRVRQDIETARHKRGEQTNSVFLAKAKNSLSHGVESGRSSGPFLAKVRKSRRIVREKGHRAAVEMEESADCKEHRQELVMIDQNH